MKPAPIARHTTFKPGGIWHSASHRKQRANLNASQPFQSYYCATPLPQEVLLG